MSFVKKKNVKL